MTVGVLTRLPCVPGRGWSGDRGTIVVLAVLSYVSGRPRGTGYLNTTVMTTTLVDVSPTVESWTIMERLRLFVRGVE